MELTRPTPDWESWLLLDDVEPDEAVALSLGIEPNTVEVVALSLGIELEPPCPDVEREFQRRLFVVNRRFRNTDGRVPLVEFAMWAVDTAKWAVPRELSALARSNSVKNEATENTARGYGTKAVLSLLAVALSRVGINPTDRHAAREIARMTAEVGISLTEETIRKILRDLSKVK